MSAADNILAESQVSQLIVNQKAQLTGIAQTLNQVVSQLQTMPTQFASYISAVNSQYAATPTDPATAFAYSCLQLLTTQQNAILSWATALQTAVNGVAVPAGV
jgi:phage-related protein